jgi:hypothetical protein
MVVFTDGENSCSSPLAYRSKLMRQRFMMEAVDSSTSEQYK